MSLWPSHLIGGHTSELVDHHIHERQRSLLTQHTVQEVKQVTSELTIPCPILYNDMVSLCPSHLIGDHTSEFVDHHIVRGKGAC